jgi:hypothetical protein
MTRRIEHLRGQSREEPESMNFSRLNETDRARLALELTMRDALEGMEELASLDTYWFDSGCLEILSIEPPHPSEIRGVPRHASANVLTFPEKRLRVG